MVRESLRNQQAYDYHLAWLRQEIAKGDADIAAGRVIDMPESDEEFLAMLDDVEAEGLAV